MQLVGADDVLRLLGDLALCRGKELRADGRAQHVQQHGLERLRAARSLKGRQVPHQGLGDGAVDRVHAHVVPVVGGPAQRQLRQVARAHDQAADLVGDVHEHLRALAGLAVLIGDVVVVHILADVGKVLLHGLGDGDRAQLHAVGLGELFGVAARAGGGAKAGHRHREDAATGKIQVVKGVGHDDEGEGGVQPAGQAHHRAPDARVLQARDQPAGLQGEDLLAALGQVRLALRHKGRGRDLPQERELAQGQGEGRPRQGRAGRKGVRPAAVRGEALHVHVADRHLVPEALRLGQDRAVLRDEVMAGKDHVLRGLPAARVRIGVGAQEPAALALHEAAAVGRLADDLVAGREVEQHRRAGQRERLRGRRGHPEVLADLHAHDQVRHLLTGEELARAQAHALAAEFDLLVHALARGEVAQLVELPVVGDVRLGHKAEDAPGAQHRRAVVERRPAAHGQAHRKQQVQVRRARKDRGERLLRAAHQRVLQEEVAAGIAREPQLREDRNARARLRRALGGADRLRRIAGAVGHAQVGRDGRDAHKTVDHAQKPLYRGFLSHLMVAQAGQEVKPQARAARI